MALKYEIEKNVAVISEKNNGWKKELNIIKWGENPSKFDIREWDEHHEKMGKGVTFTEAELKALKTALDQYFDA